MSPAFYVTGTDTGIGKTRVCVALLGAFADAGIAASGMKPLASGCQHTPGGWRNEDAEALLAASTTALDYDQVNPIALPAATAPEIAAAAAGITVDLDAVESAFSRLAAKSELCVVEGVGGWLAPLSPDLLQADLVQRLALPVVLVVGLRLGCINHALLSLRALQQDGAAVLGWIASAVDPALDFPDETLAILRRRLPAPCLGSLAHGANRLTPAPLPAALAALRKQADLTKADAG